MSKYRIWLLLLFACIIPIRLFYISHLGLCEDEGYYWHWAQNLDISYFDHPPMVAYIIAFFTSLFSNTELWVRMGALLCSVGTSIVIFLLCVDLFNDEKTGFFSVLLLNLLPVFNLGAILILPDGPLALFWMLTLYSVYRATQNKGVKWWYLSGIFLALSFLSKYFAVLLIPTVFLYLLVSKENRIHLLKKEVYLTILIGLAGLIPSVVWNYQHNWASFVYHLESRHIGAGLSFRNIGLYLGGQVGFITPLVWILCVYCLIKIGIKHRKNNLLFLFSASIPTFLFFTVIGCLSPDFKPHWTALSYIPLCIAVVYLIGKKLKIAAFVSALPFTLLIYIQSLFPLLPLEPKFDITSELYGWEQVGEKTASIADEMSSEHLTFLFTNRWMLSGRLAFYTEGKYLVTSIDPKVEQYDFWVPLDSLKGYNAVFVTDSHFRVDPSKKFKFDSFIPEVPLEIYRYGKKTKEFYIWKCYNFHGKP